MQTLSITPPESPTFTQTQSSENTQNTSKTNCFTWFCCWCCKKRTSKLKTNNETTHPVVSPIVLPIINTSESPIQVVHIANRLPSGSSASSSSTFLGGRTRTISLEQAKNMHRRTESDLINQSKQKAHENTEQKQEQELVTVEQEKAQKAEKKDDLNELDFIRQEEPSDTVIIIDD